jgi:hypothetical protein
MSTQIIELNDLIKKKKDYQKQYYQKKKLEKNTEIKEKKKNIEPIKFDFKKVIVDFD